jgi:hypothetical protein
MDQLLLLRRVRAISLQAAPAAPAQVSQRTFDAAPERSRLELPVARSISRQLKLPWPAVLELALAPPETHAHRLGRALTRPEQSWLTEEHISYVLRLVARRLGVESVSPDQYRREREAMLAVSRRRRRRLRLPTEDQLRIAVGGDWDAALALAGLSARKPHAGVGVSTVELLERCYQAHGAQSSAEELRRFARANRIPFQPDRRRTWNECVAAWKQERRARGLAVPDGLPPRGQRPNYSRNIGAALPGERRRRDWSHIEDCIEIVIVYLDQLAPNARSSKRSYQDWAAGRDDAPSYSAFDAHGGWERVRALAMQR